MRGPIPVLANVGALALVALACTSSDSTIDTAPDAGATTEVPAPTSEPPPRSSTFEGAMFEVEVPAGWTSEGHPDDSGVTLRFAEGSVDVTLVPTKLLAFLLVEAPTPITTDFIAEEVVPKLSAREGANSSDPVAVTLPSGIDALSLTTTSAVATGEVIFAAVAEDLIAIVTAAVDGPYEPHQDTARAMVGSLALTGSADDLIEVLDPPPWPEFLD